MLKTPLNEWHHQHQGRMVDFAGWEMPVQYTSIVEEHHAVRKACGLFDISHMGRILISGPDQVAWVDSFTTNDVAKMKSGQVRYALVTNHNGGILDDILIYRLPETIMLVVNASNREKIWVWMQNHRSGYDVEAVDTTFDTSMIAVQGPHAVHVLESYFKTTPAKLGYYKVRSDTCLGTSCLLSRTGYTGEDGFEIIIDNNVALDLWQSLLTTGYSHGIKPCGLGCRDTLRLEAGMPLYGHELSEEIDPITAGLEFGVKLDGADFHGKPAITAKIPTMTRVALILAGKRIARENTPVINAGKTIGTVTSGTFSPTLQKTIAMAYIPTALATPGTKLEVDLRGKPEPATVSELPFYSRTN
jgi:aminomethyltransferase